MGRLGDIEVLPLFRSSGLLEIYMEHQNMSSVLSQRSALELQAGRRRVNLPPNKRSAIVADQGYGWQAPKGLRISTGQ